MVRTQISLAPEELQALDRVARATGRSRSELIRRAVRATYAGHGIRRGETTEERLANLQAAAGAWRDRSFTGEEYVRAIRSGDMNANLRRLGVD
jgi:predicted transcriptional regulator